MFGSDHCPVFIDLHDSIKRNGETILLRDLLNPTDRPPSTGPVFPWDEPRSAPQPPRFATKFMEEFSAKQRTLKSLWANTKPKSGPVAKKEENETATPNSSKDATSHNSPEPSTAMGIARAAFGALDSQPSSSRIKAASQLDATQPTQSSTEVAASQASTQAKRSASPGAAIAVCAQPAAVDLTLENSPPAKKVALERTKSASVPKGKAKKPPAGGQAKLAAFWTMPKPKPKAKAKDPTPPYLPSPSAACSSKLASPSEITFVDMDEPPDTVQDGLLAQALADEDAEKVAEREASRQAKNDAAGSQWASMFAPKKAPLCLVHHHPCKDFSECATKSVADSSRESPGT